MEDGGFVFKVRKSRLEEMKAASLALEEGASHKDPEPVAEDSYETEKKRKKLLTLKAMYDDLYFGFCISDVFAFWYFHGILAELLVS